MNELLQSRTMKLMVHLSLVLLNILWVSFFYTDPLEVFVQRRSSSSSDEEMMVGEFCLQTPSDLMWTFHVSADGTTTDVPNREKKNKLDQSYSEPKHLNSPQFLQTRTPTDVSSIRGLNEATAAAPSLHKPTSAAGTSQLVSSRSSEAAPVRTTGSSKEDQHVTDSCCSEYSSINVPLDVIVGVNMSNPECSLPAVMFITSSDQLICADPCETFTVQMIDSMSTTEETSPSDKRVSSIRGLNEATAAAPSLHKPTSAAGTSQLVSSRSSEAAPVGTTGSSKAPVRQRVKRLSYESCCFGYARIRIPPSRIKVYRMQDTSECNIKAVKLITTSGRVVCFNPDDRWIQMVLERLQRREKLQCLTDIIKSSSFA